MKNLFVSFPSLDRGFYLSTDCYLIIINDSSIPISFPAKSVLII